MRAKLKRWTLGVAGVAVAAGVAAVVAAGVAAGVAAVVAAVVAAGVAGDLPMRSLAAARIEAEARSRRSGSVRS